MISSNNVGNSAGYVARNRRLNGACGVCAANAHAIRPGVTKMAPGLHAGSRRTVLNCAV